MRKYVVLSDILLAVRDNGHLGYIKIMKPKNIPGVNQLSLAVTIFKKRYVNKKEGDEILIFGKEELNITKLEDKLTIHTGDVVNIYAGGRSFYGKLVD